MQFVNKMFPNNMINYPKLPMNAYALAYMNKFNSFPNNVMNFNQKNFNIDYHINFNNQNGNNYMGQFNQQPIYQMVLYLNYLRIKLDQTSIRITIQIQTIIDVFNISLYIIIFIIWLQYVM